MKTIFKRSLFTQVLLCCVLAILHRIHSLTAHPSPNGFDRQNRLT